MTASSLRDRRILVVEDEYYLMLELCDGLQAAQAVVVGPAASVEEALNLIASGTDIEAAVLDVNLGGEVAYPVADALLARGTPFVFATGYSDGKLDQDYPTVPRVEKPAEFQVIADALKAVLGKGKHD